MPPLILLVDADRSVLKRTESVLSNAGLLVAAVSSYPEAKHLLRSISPDLLIADVRLDAFNGLHLAVRSRIERPDLPVIITNGWADEGLENEARRQGAAFVVDPLANPAFMPLIESTLAEYRRRQQPIRRWPRKEISGVVQAQLSSYHARILDLSYGGFRLALDNARSLPEVFDVTLPEAGLTVRARHVWGLQSPTSDEYWCGAELLDDNETPSSTIWRTFVDSA